MSEMCDGYLDVSDLDLRRSRRDRPCDACERTIRKGDRYARHAMLYEGHWEVTVRCGACQATYAHLCDLCSRSRDNDIWPNPQLACGLSYAEEWGQIPEEVGRLAFLTDDEASALLGGEGSDAD